jgi:hypothetical protein
MSRRQNRPLSFGPPTSLAAIAFIHDGLALMDPLHSQERAEPEPRAGDQCR